MTDAVEPLLVDLVEWIGREERSYLDVMDAWRTSCPRLPVWELAVERGLVARGAMVTATAAGKELLSRKRSTFFL